MIPRVDSAAFRPVFRLRQVGAACCLAAALAATGCFDSDGSGARSGSGAGGAGTEKSSDEKAAENCRNLLDNVLSMAQPDRFGISADAEQVLGVLNEWQHNCGTRTESAVPQADGGMRLSPRLSAAARERMEEVRFRRRDIEHLRTCILARTIATQVAAGARDDLERARRLFDHVVRNMPLLPADRAPITGLPVQALIDGEGTAADRTRLLADLLRQIRLDVVVVHPGTDADRPAGTKGDGTAASDEAPSASSSGRWLLGVAANKELHLFDPFLGLPVPAAGEWQADRLSVDSVEIVPATLSSLADPADDLLARLDADSERPWGWHDADFSRPRIEIVGDSSLWSERAARLQGLLSGQRAATVFDALDDGPRRRSVATRVAEAGGGSFAATDVGIWSVPEDADPDAAPTDDAVRQARSAREFVLSMPSELRDGTHPGDWPKLGRPERTLLKTRLVQLAGRPSDAIKGYLEVRLRGRIPPQWNAPADLRAAHLEAEGDARFWTAVCMYENEQPEDAVSTLIEYRKHFRQGRWAAPATFLLARSLHRSGDRSGAVATLADVPPGDPLRPAAQLLAARWNAARAAAAAPADPPAQP